MNVIDFLAQYVTFWLPSLVLILVVAVCRSHR